MTHQGIKIAAIAAVAENGIIGRGNDLPWRISSEFAYFKRTTLGKPIVMGRKTFDTLGGALPGRPNIVVTRDQSWTAEGVTVCHSLEDALNVALKMAREMNVFTVFIGGGSEIYRQCLPFIDALYLTEVHLQPIGDAYFPPFDRAEFTEVKRERHPAREDEDAAYSITVLERKTPARLPFVSLAANAG